VRAFWFVLPVCSYGIDMLIMVLYYSWAPQSHEAGAGPRERDKSREETI
jgi:hypothetical protein